MRPGPERDELILRYLPSVRRIAAALARRAPSWRAMADDLHSAGLEGLVRGARDYDPGKGSSEKTYLERRISGAILDLVRTEDHLTRAERQRARATGVEPRTYPLRLDDASDASLHEVLPNARAEEPSEAVARRRAVAAVERAARGLPMRSREILRLYYTENLTQKQIGVAMGLTEVRICQLLRAAHGVLRAALGQPPAERSSQAPYSRRPRSPLPEARWSAEARRARRSHVA